MQLKINLGIILGAALGAIVIIVAVAYLIAYFFLLPANQPGPPEGAAAPPPATTSLPAATSPPAVSSPPATATIQPTKTVNQTPTTPTPTQPDDVSFDFVIISVSEEGMTTRKVTAQLTNTGTTEAHNTLVKIEAYSQGSPIKLNGQKTLQEEFGTVKAGKTITREVSVSFSVFDAPKLMQNGVSFKITISSDEKSQEMSYDYQP